jgi:MYXO-CTERM domain-containing protein
VTPTATPTESTTSTTSTTATDEPAPEAAPVPPLNLTPEEDTQLADANTHIAQSLQVKHEGGDDILTWDDVDGADGYQVFSHHSPFVLVGSLGKGAHLFRHGHAADGTRYVVTAIYDNRTLAPAQLDAGIVPGFTGVPDGEVAASAHGAPSPGMTLMALALLGAVLVARRRLP